MPDTYDFDMKYNDPNYRNYTFSTFMRDFFTAVGEGVSDMGWLTPAKAFPVILQAIKKFPKNENNNFNILILHFFRIWV